MPLSSIFPAYVLGHPKGEKGTREVPGEERPKSRPPRNLRDRIPFYGKLPLYSGPYGVGFMEFEIPAKNPRVFSDITRHDRHILSLETVLVTIYYPCAIGSGSGPSPAGTKHWSRPTWLTRPRDKISRGYARFGTLPEWPTMLFFLATTWFTKIPAYRNAKLANHWAAEHNAIHDGRVLKTMDKVKNTEGETPPGEPEQPIFPLIMFSHGLGGTRTAYSSVCGEYASYGFIVCAIEHRDGSGPRTLINHPPEGLGSRLEREKASGIDHLPEDKERPYDLLDFIFPKYDPWDTTPGHDIDYELRGAQLEMRQAEIEEAYEVMKTILAGQGQTISDTNLRGRGAPGASGYGLIGVDWEAWKGRFHENDVTMVGHSFGAATTVEVLRHADRFNWISSGILYDIWGMVVQPALDDPRHRIHAPILMINSEAFMYWPANFKVVKAIAEEAQEQGAPCWLMTIRGTVHISQSDFCILYPQVAALIMKQTINPVRAIDLNITASLEFLARVLPLSKKPFHRCLEDPKLLDLPCLEEMPTEHQPEEKWMAYRLRIPQEARKKLLHGGRRKFENRLRASGESEVWMHISPTEQGLSRFASGKKGKQCSFPREPVVEHTGMEKKSAPHNEQDGRNGETHYAADVGVNGVVATP